MEQKLLSQWASSVGYHVIMAANGKYGNYLKAIYTRIAQQERKERLQSIANEIGITIDELTGRFNQLSNAAINAAASIEEINFKLNEMSKGVHRPNRKWYDHYIQKPRYDK